VNAVTGFNATTFDFSIFQLVVFHLQINAFFLDLALMTVYKYPSDGPVPNLAARNSQGNVLPIVGFSVDHTVEPFFKLTTKHFFEEVKTSCPRYAG
jgi:hypothetical protein